jgi:hypothetical protein
MRGSCNIIVFGSVCATCDYSEQVFDKLHILRIEKKLLHVSAAVRSLLQGMSVLKDACSVAIINFTI